VADTDEAKYKRRAIAGAIALNKLMMAAQYLVDLRPVKLFFQLGEAEQGKINESP